jgi:transcriptional regulator with XRE-family HTH domain
MRPSQKIFGKKLKEARDRAYLVQRELAKAVGVIPDRIAAIEQAEVAGIDRNRVPDFARALRMTEEQFLAEVGAPASAKISSRPKSVRLTRQQQDSIQEAAARAGQDAEEWLSFVLEFAITNAGAFANRKPDTNEMREYVELVDKMKQAAPAHEEPARPVGKTQGKKAG